jgi:asparagine synthase (glutamine-hydrolysing)
LRGMFSFVIYDAAEQTLFAARDRFGIKPLYYHVSPHGVAFASEIKQLVDLQGFSRKIDLARMHDYLSTGFTDHCEGTLFADAQQLRGGQCVTIDLKSDWRARWGGRALPIRRWYHLPRQPLPKMSEAEAAAQFRALFEDAVRTHLRADVKTGTCLSGGLDSSSIAVMIDQLAGGIGEPLNTVTACFEDKSVDERGYAEAVVAATRSNPHYVYPGAQGIIEIIEKMTWHQDEPFYNTTQYPQWCVFEEARAQSIKVMLDGQGADEVLAGYYHDAFSLHAGAMLARGNAMGLARQLRERKQWHGIGYLQQLLIIPNRPRAPRWLRRGRGQAAPMPGEAWLDSPLLASFADAPDTTSAMLARDGLGPIADIGNLCVADLLGKSLPRLLRYEDRNSMAHSVEARLPFLDHPLAEFAIGLWDQHKVVGGDTKRVLRSAMGGQLPAKVAQRRDKLGFATPQEQWFRGALQQELERGVRQTLDLFPGLFNEGEVMHYLRSAMDGTRSADQRLWQLFNLGVWGKVFGMQV